MNLICLLHDYQGDNDFDRKLENFWYDLIDHFRLTVQEIKKLKNIIVEVGDLLSEKWHIEGDELNKLIEHISSQVS